MLATAVPCPEESSDDSIESSYALANNVRLRAPVENGRNRRSTKESRYGQKQIFLTRPVLGRLQPSAEIRNGAGESPPSPQIQSSIFMTQIKAVEIAG